MSDQQAAEFTKLLVARSIKGPRELKEAIEYATIVLRTRRASNMEQAVQITRADRFFWFNPQGPGYVPPVEPAKVTAGAAVTVESVEVQPVSQEQAPASAASAAKPAQNKSNQPKNNGK